MRDRLEKLWVRTRLSLPTPLLRGMSGGAAVGSAQAALNPPLDPLRMWVGHVGAGFTPEEARLRDARQSRLMAPPLAQGSRPRP